VDVVVSNPWFILRYASVGDHIESTVSGNWRAFERKRASVLQSGDIPPDCLEKVIKNKKTL
jgi:hypothetical protein